MRRFFKRNKNRNLKLPERRIIFKLNDGSWKQLFRVEGAPARTFRELIASSQKMFKEKYVGAYDIYKFFLGNDTILEISTKFSYEEVWDMWMSLGGKNEMWGLKMSKDEEWNKQVIITSMLRQFGEGKTLGTGNLEIDKKLAHDSILIGLARLGAIQKKSERLKSLLAIERLIERYSLLENEVDNFNKIIDSMKKA